jgi:hypothetical protein
MTTCAFESCPRCGEALQAGFAHRAIGLSFVAPEKLSQFVSLDEDLAESGLKKILPSLAEYFRSYLCRSCELYLIDFSTLLSHAQTKKLANSMTAPATV